MLPLRGTFSGLFVIIYLQLDLYVRGSSAAACEGLSSEVICTCGEYGRCEQGTVQVDPWLQNTLTTQVEVQLDIPFNHVQLLDAHNAYNNRAFGLLYGSNDNCVWPPPYDPSICVGIANQEFSLTDLLNFGIRGIELDNWYCNGQMRLAHLGTNSGRFCNSQHVLFATAVEEIGSWLDDHPEAFIRIYMNEKFDQGNDASINDPFERYLGNRILTPADLKDTFNGEWPTLRSMRKAGKNVVIGQLSTAGANEFYVHQGKYIHKAFWTDFKRREFTNYPQCGGKNDTNILRFYSDSTHYVLDNQFLDGPSRVGYIDDLSEFIKCRVQYPAGDQITPLLTATAVYTWAKGEPANPITDSASCILLSSTDNRWYAPSNCNQNAFYACQNTMDSSDWSVSESAGGYDVDTSACPPGYRFSLPQNGYQHQKLLEAIAGESVWLNVSPLLADYEPPTSSPEVSNMPSRAHYHFISRSLLLAATFVFLFVRFRL